MSALVSMARCPNCGAPLPSKPGLRYAICIFYNSSVSLMASSEPGATPQFVAQSVSKEDIEKVKQLLVDGKRAEAVDLYARAAAVSHADAELAVDGVFLSVYRELTRHLPINGFGVLLYMAIMVGAGLGVSAWGASGLPENPAYAVWLGLGAVFAIWRIVAFSRHLRATLSSTFGAMGRGRVVRESVVREFKDQQGYFIVVVFEVTPDDGTAPFVDQETLFVGPEALGKLAPGNAVRVRFDGARGRVFPISPVTVIA